MEIDEEENLENILSICWDGGKTSAVVYELSTLELKIFYETTDLRPDYAQLKHIFQQVTPSYLVATGSNTFFEEIVKLLDPTSSHDFNKFKATKNKAADANVSNVIFYPLNLKNQDGLRKRIYDLDLPGISAKSSKSDRVHFIDSVLPMSSELMIACLGNLLKYLLDNHAKWRHAFLTLDRNPIISNVLVSTLESQVLVDEYSFNSLNIFSKIYHPSNFKIQIRKDGLSLYNLLNQCCSAVGSQELRTILKQPTRNILELNMRFSTVEWCMKDENKDHVARFKTLLGGLVNVNNVFRRILFNQGNNISNWKSFKRTIYNINSICHLCSSFSKDSIQGTFFAELAEFFKEGISINGILFSIEKIVDFEAIEEKNRFIIKKGLDQQLDDMNEALSQLIDNFNGIKPEISLSKLNPTRDAFQFIHFPEIGFVVGTMLKTDDLNLTTIQEDGIEFILNTIDARYFRTANCKALNEEYEKQMTSIVDHELIIFKKLIKYINENFAELTEAAKICAKLDCLISFSIVSSKHNYVRPKVTNDHQLSIVNGRHPLVELIKSSYVPNTTIIDENNKNFINIIRAPNSTGKSVYIKKIALICFMTFIGCFVPAESCTVSLLHSIYTRIYTPESIYHNESAFMSDLQQMSKIVMQSTNRSLILIDEFAKGTFYKDGIAILTSTIEHFAERGHLTPFVFITTHYPQIFTLVRQPCEFAVFKTIATNRNQNNIFQSTYELTSGVNDQQCCTEYPESKKIIKNIFNNKQRDNQLRVLNRATATSIKAFILILAKMMLRKNAVTYEFIHDIYTKVDIENFLNL